MTVKVPASRPENPDKTPVAPSVKPLADSVPLPDSVPFSMSAPPLVELGLFPSGKLQLLLTDSVPAVCVKVTKLKTALLQLIVDVPTTALLKLTVPPLALKVEPALKVMLPLNEAVPDGAVNTPVELIVKVLLTVNVLYVPKSYVPLIVSAVAASPEKPDRLPPLFNVSVPFVDIVPLPESVPLSTTDPPPDEPTWGLLPSGRLQSLLTVLVWVVCVNVTRLKTALLQVIVAALMPLKLIVPPLALKVEPLLRVKLPPKLAVPDGAVKTPPELRVRVPDTVNVVYEL